MSFTTASPRRSSPPSARAGNCSPSTLKVWGNLNEGVGRRSRLTDAEFVQEVERYKEMARQRRECQAGTAAEKMATSLWYRDRLGIAVRFRFGHGVDEDPLKSSKRSSTRAAAFEQSSAQHDRGIMNIVALHEAAHATIARVLGVPVVRTPSSAIARACARVLSTSRR